MRVVVKLFAILRDRANTGQLLLELPDRADVSSALTALGHQLPPIQPMLSRAAYAVNQSYSPATTMLRDGDELAIIPPVSGG